MTDKPPYAAANIANYFIEKSNQDKNTDAGWKYILTPMKLQKLIYFAHGWHYGLFNEPLITESFQTWDYGPVVPSLYHTLKRYADQRVTDKIEDAFGDEFKSPNHQGTLLLLDQIWEIYGHVDGLRLSNMTHEPNSPWDRLLERLPNGQTSITRNREIPNKMIKDYFGQLIKTLESQQNIGG